MWYYHVLPTVALSSVAWFFMQGVTLDKDDKRCTCLDRYVIIMRKSSVSSSSVLTRWRV